MKRQMTRRSFLTRTAAGTAGGGFVVFGNSPSARSYMANENAWSPIVGVRCSRAWSVRS